jgi:RNA polymerase sigma-70 factor (ECF subfamily)
MKGASPFAPDTLWSGPVEERFFDAAEEEATHTELPDRVARGDVDALEALYRQHHEAVRAFARRLLGNAAIAEDLVHDVFLAAPRAFRGFQGQAQVRTFLLSIAVNKAKHHTRAAARWRGALERLKVEPKPPPQTRPDETSERRELRDELQRALDTLPLEQRVVVVLCAIEERTAIEVAAIVGAPENTVRTRLFHAKRRLREIMGDDS